MILLARGWPLSASTGLRWCGSALAVSVLAMLMSVAGLAFLSPLFTVAVPISALLPVPVAVFAVSIGFTGIATVGAGLFGVSALVSVAAVVVSALMSGAAVVGVT